ncbi:hypothetical protein NMY22_g11874 [Coprinellus aureogranulatus]|nr:hypothetical protein NMY22_g11874 [Coprinellus aureogranulatus]
MIVGIRAATRRGFATHSSVKGFDGAIGNTPLIYLKHLSERAGASYLDRAKAEFQNPGGSVKDRACVWDIIKQLRSEDETDAWINTDLSMMFVCSVEESNGDVCQKANMRAIYAIVQSRMDCGYCGNYNPQLLVRAGSPGRPQAEDMRSHS